MKLLIVYRVRKEYSESVGLFSHTIVIQTVSPYSIITMIEMHAERSA